MKKSSERRQAKVAPTRPELIPQPHGGALLAGGLPGHRGGSGRPPSAVREAMRLALEERLPILARLADDEDVAPRDRINAIRVLAHYGLGTVEERIEKPALPEGVNLRTADGRAKARAMLATLEELDRPNPLPGMLPAQAVAAVQDAEFTILEEK